jgi:hypothetical protein
MHVKICQWTSFFDCFLNCGKNTCDIEVTIGTIFKSTYGSEMLSMLTLLCNQIPEPFHLAELKLVPINHQQTIPHCQPLTTTRILLSICIYECDQSRYLMCMESFSICLLVTALFHLVWCPQSPSLLYY